MSILDIWILPILIILVLIQYGFFIWMINDSCLWKSTKFYQYVLMLIPFSLYATILYILLEKLYFYYYLRK
jgi:uncharacterized membrane protein YvlD (DUF360 family)